VYEKDGAWWIDYRTNGRYGKRKREKIGPSKQLAKTVLQKRKVEIAEGKFLDRRNIDKTPFKDFAEQFLKVHSSTKKSEALDIRMVDRFCERWGKKLLRDITPKMVQEWQSERAAQVKRGTVNREMECLKTLFNKAVEWGKLEASPARSVRKFKLNNQRVRWLTQAEFEKLHEECSPNLKPIVMLARHTGMRRGELLALTWGDVDFRTKTLYVRDSKNGESREVPLNRTAEAALKALPRRIRDARVFRRPTRPEFLREGCGAGQDRELPLPRSEAHLRLPSGYEGRGPEQGPAPARPQVHGYDPPLRAPIPCSPQGRRGCS
jgi:integrase